MIDSVSASIFDNKDKSLSNSLHFLEQFIKPQSQSQNLIPILKLSVSVSIIETGYAESQSQSQHAKTGPAHPWRRPHPKGVFYHGFLPFQAILPSKMASLMIFTLKYL